MNSSDKIKQFYNKYLDFSKFGFLTQEDIETIVTISSSASEYTVTKDKNYYWSPSDSSITLLIDNSTSTESFHKTNLLIYFQATPNVNVSNTVTVVGEFKVGMNRAKVEWWGNDVRIYLMDAVQSSEGGQDEPTTSGDVSFDDFLFYIMKNETANWPNTLYVRDKQLLYCNGEYIKKTNRKNGCPYWQNDNKYIYASASLSNGQKFWKFGDSLPSETIIIETINSDNSYITYGLVSSYTVMPTQVSAFYVWDGYDAVSVLIDNVSGSNFNVTTTPFSVLAAQNATGSFTDFNGNWIDFDITFNGATVYSKIATLGENTYTFYLKRFTDVDIDDSHQNVTCWVIDASQLDRYLYRNFDSTGVLAYCISDALTPEGLIFTKNTNEYSQWESYGYSGSFPTFGNGAVTVPVITLSQNSVAISGTVNTALQTVNLSQYVTVTPTGTSLTYAGSNIPAGLAVTSAGVLSGTPTATSSSSGSVTVSAVNAQSKTLTLNFSITEVQGGGGSSELPTSIIVSGADKSVDNGTFVQNGTMNDYPMYQKENDNPVIFYSNGRWHLCDHIDEWNMGGGSDYMSTSEDLFGTWDVSNYGSSPAPTVTDASAVPASVDPDYDSLIIYDDTINKMDDIRLDKVSGLTKNGQPVWSGTTRWLDKNSYTGDTYYLYAASSQSKKGWVVSKTLPEEANPVWDNYMTQEGDDTDGDGIIDEVYYEYADSDKYGARGEVSTFDTMPWQVDIWSYVVDMEGGGEERTMQSGDFKIKAFNTIEFPQTYYVIDTYATDNVNFTGVYQKQSTLISGIYPTYYDSVNNHSIVISKSTSNFSSIYRNQNMWKFCNGAPDTTGTTNSTPSTPYFMKQENWGYPRYNFSNYDIYKTPPPAFGWYVNNSTLIDNPSQDINDPKVGLSKFIVQTMPLQQIPASDRTGSFAHPYYWYDKVETNDGTSTQRHAKYTPFLQKTANAGLPSPAGSGFAIYVYLQAGIEYKFGGNVNGEYVKAGVMLCSDSGTVLASDYCTNVDPEDGSGYGGKNRTIHGIATNSFFKYTPSQSGWYKFCGYMIGDDNEWDEAQMGIRMYMDPVPIWGATTVTGNEYNQ